MMSVADLYRTSACVDDTSDSDDSGINEPSIAKTSLLPGIGGRNGDGWALLYENLWKGANHVATNFVTDAHSSLGLRHGAGRGASMQDMGKQQLIEWIEKDQRKIAALDDTNTKLREKIVELQRHEGVALGKIKSLESTAVNDARRITKLNQTNTDLIHRIWELEGHAHHISQDDGRASPPLHFVDHTHHGRAHTASARRTSLAA